MFRLSALDSFLQLDIISIISQTIKSGEGERKYKSDRYVPTMQGTKTGGHSV